MFARIKAAVVAFVQRKAVRSVVRHAATAAAAVVVAAVLKDGVAGAATGVVAAGALRAALQVIAPSLGV
jgi:hypothetical protein